MKKIFCLVFLSLVALPLAAERPTTPKTGLNRPTTNAVKAAPRSNVVVEHAQTSSEGLNRPDTPDIGLNRPTTLGGGAATQNASSAAEGKTANQSGNNSAGGSYTPSYKKAKDFNKADGEKRSSLGAGEKGLGINTPTEEQKAALAEAKFFKPDMAQESTNKFLDQAAKQLPGGFDKTLKNKTSNAAQKKAVKKK